MSLGRSIASVIVGYLIFALSAFALFQISGQPPHQAAPASSMAGSIVNGAVFDTEADADCWVDRCEQSIGSPMTNFALRTPSGYLIGAIGVVGALSADAHSAEFGYWLAQSYRGRGLMPRVIRTFSDYAFQELRIHRLFATPFSSNLASHRALEKAGFQREGLLRHHHLKQGIYLDAIIYGRISDSN